LQRPALQVVGPENVLGIERNPYAAELARVSIWIGEIQWMRRNGFEAARNPILRTLTNIENRDAVLNTDGTRAEWPEADAVVGNPPFLGNKKMIGKLGKEYTTALRSAWADVPAGVDLVAYWFAKAWEMLLEGRLVRAGLVATQSIRRGTNRTVLRGAADIGQIFEVWSDEEWTVDGADVRVSLVCFSLAKGQKASLDGRLVDRIGADLKEVTEGPQLVPMRANKKIAGQGTISGGPFEISPSLARKMLCAPINPNGETNAAVLRPWRNGDDLTDRPTDWWIVDFGEREISEAALFEQPFEFLEKAWAYAQDERRKKNERLLREGEPKTAARWWIMQRRRDDLLKAIGGQRRYLVTPRVSKHRFFVWLDPQVIPDTRLVAFRKEDDTFAGLLHSRFHEAWSLRLAGRHGVGNDPEYVHTEIFETFPFPDGLTPDIPAAAYADHAGAKKIAASAARLNQLRENWLNPSDLVDRVPEVVPGYPDRILAKNDSAAAELKKRTLTNLYNARPAWLDHAHRELDEAVAEAYGWGDDWRAGKLTDDEILARLFRLNQERAEAEKKA
jgi:type II restriction/modification system DNA methylase subunit YeeA